MYDPNTRSDKFTVFWSTKKIMFNYSGFSFQSIFWLFPQIFGKIVSLKNFFCLKTNFFWFLILVGLGYANSSWSKKIFEIICEYNGRKSNNCYSTTQHYVVLYSCVLWAALPTVCENTHHKHFKSVSNFVFSALSGKGRLLCKSFIKRLVQFSPLPPLNTLDIEHWVMWIFVLRLENFFKLVSFKIVFFHTKVLIIVV